MSEHIIAVQTYGSQRVKHPHTGETISAQKIGYSSAASAVLLALHDDRARDVSSKQASYHYIQIDAEVTVRRGYILLKVTDAELAQAETITRQVSRPAVYRWQDDQWLEFPKLNMPDYTPIVGRSGPSFNPTGMRIVAASTGEAEAAVAGITVEMSQRSETDTPWHWLRGDTFPHRETLKRWGCRWSKKRKSWYYIGAALPDAVQQLIEQVNAEPPANVSDDDHDPCSVEEAAAILGLSVRDDVSLNGNGQHPETNIQEDDTPPLDEPEEAPKVRIIKPNLDVSDGDEPDAVITAVRQMTADSLPVFKPNHATANGKRSLERIAQAYCGELTGSITGQVFCYGYAVHDGVCIYVNMGGPRTGVEAIRAKLSKGDLVSIVPDDAPAVELTAGEGNSGMYHDYIQTIPEARFTSLILLHDWIVNPNYGGAATTFILRTSDDQAQAKLKHHVAQLVNLPVFDQWLPFLWTAGQAALLVHPTRAAGGIDMLTIVLDATAWSRLITGGLERGIINLPWVAL